jgi:hypothetical protein
VDRRLAKLDSHNRWEFGALDAVIFHNNRAIRGTALSFGRRASSEQAGQVENDYQIKIAQAAFSNSHHFR